MFNLSQLSNLLVEGLQELTTITPKLAEIAGGVRESALASGAWLGDHETALITEFQRLGVSHASVETIRNSVMPIGNVAGTSVAAQSAVGIVPNNQIAAAAETTAAPAASETSAASAVGTNTPAETQSSP